jgi:hypothetical protein
MDRVPGKVSWWQAIGFGRQDAAADTDYADMGTAFGLDASMAPPDWDDPADAGELPPGVDRLNGRSVL